MSQQGDALHNMMMVTRIVSSLFDQSGAGKREGTWPLAVGLSPPPQTPWVLYVAWVNLGFRFPFPYLGWTATYTTVQLLVYIITQMGHSL